MNDYKDDLESEEFKAAFRSAWRPRRWQRCELFDICLYNYPAMADYLLSALLDWVEIPTSGSTQYLVSSTHLL